MAVLKAVAVVVVAVVAVANAEVVQHHCKWKEWAISTMILES